MRRIGGISLALVDERRGLIDVRVNIVRRAEYSVRPRLVLRTGQNHEIGVATRHVQRIVRHQGHVHDATGGVLGDQVKAVVEELPKEREETVRGRRLFQECRPDRL